MARRNRKSRNKGTGTSKSAKPTEEELQQERSFFIWTAVITLVVVVGVYFLLF